jgi:hypothetical protein
MMQVRDFVAALARARKTRKEIKPLVDTAYRDNSLLIRQINRIIKTMKERKSTSDQRHSNAKKTSGPTTLWPLSTLTVDLGFVKKSARWIPKLLSTVQKDERVQRSEDFIQLLWRHSLVV